MDTYSKKDDSSYFGFEISSIEASDMFLTMLHDINNSLYDSESDIYPMTMEKMKIKSVNELWSYIDCRHDWVYYDEIDENVDGVSDTSEWVQIDGVVTEHVISDSFVTLSIRFINSDNYLTNKDFSWDFDLNDPLVLQSEYISVADNLLFLEDVQKLEENDEVRVLFLPEEGEKVEAGEIRAIRRNIESTTYYGIESKNGRNDNIHDNNNIDDAKVLYDNYIDELKSDGIVVSIEEIENGVWAICVNDEWESMTNEQKQSFANDIYYELNAWAEGIYDISATIEIRNTYGETVAESKWFGEGMEIKQ